MSGSVVARQAYNTHLNYIKCLAVLFKGVRLKYRGSLRKAKIPYLDSKKNLIDLTKRSLNDEYKIVRIDQDYSYASTSWLPVKSYYLIFNILLTIEYILKIDKKAFQKTHVSCIKEFTRKLDTGEIEFSKPLLNQVFDSSILFYRVSRGANLSSRTSLDDMYKMVIRLVAKYKLNDWKQKNNIDLRIKKHKQEHKKYLSSFRVSVFDFPYYMRIRSNYRDFAFIDDVTTTDTAKYFNYFFSFTGYFVKALMGMKSDLIKMRN